MKNPAAALDALLAPPSREVGPFRVYELTLGHVAVLERIGSPFSSGRVPEGQLDLIPTAYALTRGVAESARLLASRGSDGYLDAAYAWSESISSPEDMKALLEAVVASVARLGAATPGGGEGDEGSENPTEATATGGS